MPHFNHTILFCLLITVVLGGCASKLENPYERTEQEYYLSAKEELDDEDYFSAEKELKKLETYYPFGAFAEQAQLELMFAYYHLDNMDDVLATAERFIRLNPLHTQVDYAYYMRGLATYELGFSTLERYWPDELNERDQSAFRDSFAYFSELIERFPNSRFVPDAIARMRYLREQMASYEIAIARYYMKRHAFVAAADRATKVLLNFQKTFYVEEALVIQIEAFNELAMPEEANKAFTLLKSNYPKNKYLKDGKFDGPDLAMTDRHSFLYLITFGLLGR